MYDRILKIIRHYNLSITEFSREIGLNSAATIQKIITYKRKASPKTTGKILNRFPDIEYDWLITGQGDMIKRKETSSNNVIEQDEMTVTALQVTKYLNDRYPESSNSVEKKLSKLIEENHLHVLEFAHNGKNEIKKIISKGFDSIENRTIKIQENSEISREKFLIAHKDTLNKVAFLEKELHIMNEKISNLDILIETIEKHNLIEKEKIKKFLNPNNK
jgi:hypothetical protein